MARRRHPNGLSDDTYLFRSYDHFAKSQRSTPLNPGPAHNYKIWEVARATTAAETYFKAMRLKDPSDPTSMTKYSDGGLLNNNPSLLAWNETLFKEDCKGVAPVFVFLNIGTGDKSQSRFQRATRKLRLSKRIQRIKNGLTNTSDAFVHVDHIWNMQVLPMLPHDTKQLCIRWSGGQRIAGLKFDEWADPKKRGEQSTKEIIEGEVEKYMADRDIQEQLRRCAEALVSQRRERIKHLDRWTRNTYCTKFRCPFCGDRNQVFPATRAELIDHINDMHKDKADESVNLNAFVSLLDPIDPEIPGGPI